jgi:hypothetical protein
MAVEAEAHDRRASAMVERAMIQVTNLGWLLEARTSQMPCLPSISFFQAPLGVEEKSFPTLLSTSGRASDDDRPYHTHFGLRVAPRCIFHR